MFTWLYFFWALLPLTLLFQVVKSSIRKLLKRPGREYPLNYLRQFVFSVVGLAIAIALDHYLWDAVADLVLPGVEKSGILSFLIYPAVLLVMGRVAAQFEPTYVPTISRQLREKMEYSTR